MISFNSPNISQQSHTGILINQHITVQAACQGRPHHGVYPGLFMENKGVWRAYGLIELKLAAGNECKKSLPRPAALVRESSRNIRDGKLFVWLKPGLEET
jgi:hypothetical protein